MQRRPIPTMRRRSPRPGRARPKFVRNPSFRTFTSYTNTATNSGTVATNPTIVVTGPVTPTALFFQNVTESKTLWINQAVTSGHTLTIDFGARTITVDSTVLSGVLTADSRWWDLQPGANTILSNVAAAVTWRNASTT